MLKNTLIINPGSTAIKYTIFDEKGSVILQKKFLLTENKKNNIFLYSLENINKIGIRVVHGGEMQGPMQINKKAKSKIENFKIFAPIHNNVALEEIKKIEKIFFKKNIWAVFDTDFHQTIPEENYILPINQKIAKRYKLRKYGFHGIAVESVIKIFQNKKKQVGLVSKKINKKNKIICVHLGGGSSVSAVKNEKSIYNSMGLTPLSGIMGKTRSGNIDADIFSILDKQSLSVEKISEILTHESGFLGLTNSIDTKKIIKNVKISKQGLNIREKMAYQIYLNQISAEIAKAFLLLHGCDALILSGGIGANNEYLKNDLWKKIKILGIEKKQIFQIESQEGKLIFDKIKNKK